MLGGLHYLVLAGRLPGWDWDDVRAALAHEREWLARFTSERNVQTNEAQRSWALLPAFLTVAERPLDIVELGPSAGFNLLWDRFRFRYAAGSWGPPGAPLELAGEERSPVPGELLARGAEVRRRRGIDLEPVDVSDEEGARLLTCFVWPDQSERLERLRAAIELLRADLPEIVKGDYVELLPEVLADREPDVLTVVFQTVSTLYLPEERYVELRRIVDEADPPVAWISTRRTAEEETQVAGGFELELRSDGETSARLVAQMGYHGQWLDWLPASAAGRRSRRAAA